ncbi:MAG TPA: Asp-tRNA(Asn)/Glu-tRNA(Gln) amidotransferase subunit GatB, partial [Candidatus Omnitrophica bacterium]|nr:Asp-tRNA(Asn)/Glu-tRNA(Gln) amidotransferase subunit GatB [Candidatus Omnitrophota bacterium]
AGDGWVEITVGGEKKKVGIGNIHLEEDAGKNIHLQGMNASLVDLNRTGIPLVEIVTKPDMRNLEEVEVFMNTLKEILLYTGVSDCKMEEGSLRFEANISVRKKGENILLPRTEIKNLNSFKIVMAALEYEIRRQQEALIKGEKVLQQTRLWDEEKRRTRPMRGKEEAQDYRYFPEPDLPPLYISDDEVERVRETLPELPNKRKNRFIRQYNLTEYEANILIGSKDIADFFEECTKKLKSAKEISNWVIGPVMRLLNERNISIGESKLTPGYLVSLIGLINEGKINLNTAKSILPEVFETGKEPGKIVQESGLTQVSDEQEISLMVEQVMRENQKAVDDLKKGKMKALGFLVGQVMRISKGKANPQLVNRLFQEKLKD